MLELVSLHSTSMNIIGSMVYFDLLPVLLRTSGISYLILPERTVRRLGIKCRVVNKSLAEATYKISSSRRSPLRCGVSVRYPVRKSCEKNILKSVNGYNECSQTK